MKGTEYLIKVLAKKHNIKEKESETIINYYFNYIIENMMKSEYDAIYLLKLGTFHLDKILLRMYIYKLIHVMRGLKKKTNLRSQALLEEL